MSKEDGLDSVSFDLVDDLRRKKQCARQVMASINRDFQTVPAMLLEDLKDVSKRRIIARWLYWKVPEISQTKIAFALLGRYGEEGLVAEIGGLKAKCTICGAETEIRSRRDLGYHLKLKSSVCESCHNKINHYTSHLELGQEMMKPDMWILEKDLCPRCGEAWPEYP
jgi:uncharacterized protein YlaI